MERDREIRARLRGKLRLEKARPEHHRMRNLIMVGDHVHYRLEDSGEALIEAVVPRKNDLCRASPSEIQALGANLDRALLVVSLTNPPPRYHFVDRFLASCHAGAVEAQILFTKPDMLENSQAKKEAEGMIDLYKNLGYSVYSFDLLNQQPVSEKERLWTALKEGVTILAGQSGTGKSTLLNLLAGSALQRIGELSVHKKGRHTTTNSCLIVSGNAMFIDTPGVKEWGLAHLTRRDIVDSFPEISAVSDDCQYADCEHMPDSRGCAVHTLFNEETADPGRISLQPERLDSLLAMINSLENPDKIRMGDYIKPTGRHRFGRIRPLQ